MDALLSVRQLRVGFKQRQGDRYAVNGVDLDIARGETLVVVGESGCGKSLTALSIMGLLGVSSGVPHSFVQGRIQLREEGKQPLELVGLPRQSYDKLRGSVISMIFQEPMTALNPLLTVGEQIVEVLMEHKGLTKAQAREEAIALLGEVGIPEPERRMKAYPFQLSGGQKQRVMIAVSIACEPKLLIADEPTTALDVTIQSQILYLLNQIKQKRNTSILFITHNLGIVAQFADRVAVMYRGIIVENAEVGRLFAAPQHPYTRMLLGSVPQKGQHASAGHRLEAIPGMVPGPSEAVGGCPFHPRCPLATEQCRKELPGEVAVEPEHRVRCWEAVATHTVSGESAVMTGEAVLAGGGASWNSGTY